LGAARPTFFVQVALADVLAGLADAISGPFLALFLVDRAHLSPLWLGLLLTLRAVSGIAFSTAFGSWVDKAPSVAPLLMALIGAGFGYGALAFTTNFAALIVIAAVPMAIGASSFPQSIAVVKRHFDLRDRGGAHRGIGVIRASWSLAWAFGPAVGAAAVQAFDFQGAFLLSAACGVLAFVMLAPARATPLADGGLHLRHPHRSEPPARGLAITLALAAFALFHMAMFMGSIALPIVLTTTLNGTKTDVGLSFSICAALEIVVMGALIWRPPGRSERAAIVLGFAAFAAYYVVIAYASSVEVVLWAQILRAISIGFVSYLGIGFVQALMPGRAGAAAAGFANAAQVGSVLSALATGALAQAFGFASVFSACAVLCGAGLVLVCLVRTAPRPH